MIPLNMIGIVTWCAMYVDASDSNGIEIVLTSLLTSMAYMYILSDTVPKVSDMWMKARQHSAV